MIIPEERDNVVVEPGVKETVLEPCENTSHEDGRNEGVGTH